MNLRVSACQILTYPDVGKSTQKIKEWIGRAAKDEKADVVSFPEAAICGYPCVDGYWDNADPDAFIAAEKEIVATAKEHNIAVTVGTANWEDGHVFNSILVIDKGGLVRGRYSKTHLAEKWPKPGKHLPVYEVAGVKSCFIVCHDVRYPELVRLPAIVGAQICYFATNESGLTHDYKLSAYRCMPVARATENGVFLVMANAPADAANITSSSQSHGNSKIIHPDGNILKEARYFEETLVTCDINLEDADRRIAERSVNDETILKDWMRKGAELVDG